MSKVSALKDSTPEKVQCLVMVTVFLNLCFWDARGVGGGWVNIGQIGRECGWWVAMGGARL